MAFNDDSGNNTERNDFPKQNNLNRKLSPLDKLNTDRGMISSQAPLGMKKGSMAETSFGNINSPPNDMKDSNIDLSLISQKQHKFPSPGRSSNNQ